MNYPEVETPPFPVQLFHLLHADNLNDIVSFNAHGRAFTIHDKNRFSQEIMPVWFGHADWNQFEQDLKRYGFRRLLKEGPDCGAYYHEMFLRGQMHLLEGIQPQEYPLPSGLHEPDFSRFPVLAPSHDLPLFRLGLEQLSPGASLLPPETMGYPVLPRLMTQGSFEGLLLHQPARTNPLEAWEAIANELDLVLEETYE